MSKQGQCKIETSNWKAQKTRILVDTRVCVCQRDPSFDVIWMFCETSDKRLTFFGIFARFAIFVKIATFEGAPFNISLEVSHNPWRIFVEFDIFAMFVKIITFQGAPFANPLRRFFVRFVILARFAIFVKFAIFAEFANLPRGTS